MLAISERVTYRYERSVSSSLAAQETPEYVFCNDLTQLNRLVANQYPVAKAVPHFLWNPNNLCRLSRSLSLVSYVSSSRFHTLVSLRFVLLLSFNLHPRNIVWDRYACIKSYIYVRLYAGIAIPNDRPQHNNTTTLYRNINGTHKDMT